MKYVNIFCSDYKYIMYTHTHPKWKIFLCDKPAKVIKIYYMHAGPWGLLSLEQKWVPDA
jgi:hypothetical protein